MRMSEGVEWAVHTCLNLAWVDRDRAVSSARLAALYELPAAYLNKQMQALARAGIVSSTSGPKGGFRLARAPENISLLDIVLAIEGPDHAFRCREIRQRGPFGGDPDSHHQPCTIATALAEAEQAWRGHLQAQTIADLDAIVQQVAPAVPERTRRWLTGIPS
jgi:Rrf2 family protein